MESRWLTTEQAAEFLGMGKTKLYALSQTGKLPVSKVGKKWLYEQRALAEWLRANRNFATYFMETAANIENNTNLREPQREAYSRAYEFFSSSKQKAVIQLPVGCGKSGVASILPFGIAKGRVR